MASPKQSINPFHLLTGIVGTLFTITACGYVLLMLRTSRGPISPEEAHPLMRLMNSHGATILIVEVTLLAVVAVAAIMLDHYRGKRQL